MTSASSAQVLAATRQWLKPLIHVLIRCGVTWKDFAALSKTTYVEVATRQFGKRGRPTNVSRTAVLTGLARREVRKQRERLASGPEAWTGYVTKASLVLDAWHHDPLFQDGDGKPLLLSLQGEGTTFTTLVRRCGASDVRPSTLLKELKSAGAIRATDDGRYEVLQRHYIPHTMDEEMIRLWGTGVSDISTTYVHNLTRTPSTPARFERSAINFHVRASAVPEFRQFLAREGQALLERMDDWLSKHEARPKEGQKEGHKDGHTDDKDPSTATVRLGVGMYHIQD
ncbi:MAG TPA: DUF6502 family protein [Steroidobacteraceae bacterium]|jgi:hypothetical protein